MTHQIEPPHQPKKEYTIHNESAHKLALMRAAYSKVPEAETGDAAYFPNLLAKGKIASAAQDMLHAYSPDARKEVAAYLSGNMSLEGLKSIPARSHAKAFGEFREAYGKAKSGACKIEESNFMKKYCKSRGLGVSTMESLRFLGGQLGTESEFASYVQSRPAQKSETKSQGRKI